MPSPVEVRSPASSRSEVAPVAADSALASLVGVSVPLDEDPLVLVVAPWSPDEIDCVEISIARTYDLLLKLNKKLYRTTCIESITN